MNPLDCCHDFSDVFEEEGVRRCICLWCFAQLWAERVEENDPQYQPLETVEEEPTHLVV